MADKSATLQEKLSYSTLSKSVSAIGLFLLLIGMWFVPPPSGLSLQAWHLLAIFLATIMALIANLLPMGAIGLITLTVCTVTHTLSLKQALSEFSSNIAWLILMAFMLARGFIKTGLGARLAYYFVLFMGKSTLGLGYGIAFTELLLSPLMPSNTARGAGIVFPIIQSLATEYGSKKSLGTERKIGSYLMKLAYHSNVITSAMFLTATVGNPLVAKFASELGIQLTWTSWALAALVPGFISLSVLPVLLYFVYPPEIKHTPKAAEFARQKLKDLGSMKFSEYIMLGTFVLLLVLWVFGEQLNMDATVAAFLGVAILIATRVLSFDDILNEHTAWHTFVWLTILLTLSKYLAEFGMTTWLSEQMQPSLQTLPWVLALSLVALVYFYTHYVFASMTAHIGALFSPLVLVAIASQAPPALSVLLLGFLSSLCASITHYGTGSAPIYFGAQYVTLRDWWRVGALVSLVNLAIWGSIGPLWWKMIGFW